ncbi:hypothetical protein BDN70DRAFT_56286 [Pholiota conissans]|uniref:Uncharacterized protein n=1 Tax=Pholiota conissans TaxID=109636 RepID=A0A9P5ZC99_9AGAR|nr:hypothetical protein BDN70DRAFT_56286 [Pholiota conissans]
METTPAKTPLNEERTDVTPPPTNSSTPPLPAKRPIKIMPSKQPKTASTAQPSSAPHIVKPVDVATLEPPTVYMPHTHKIMKEKGLRITAPRDPFLRPPRSRPDSDFFKPQEKYTPRPASSYPRLYPSSRKSKTVEGDATLSCSESKASLSGSVKAQSSKDSDLLSSKSRTPEFVISQAARIRVLPGAIPSSEYHAPEDDDILALQPVAQTMTQQSWLGRVVGRIFSW